MATIHQPQAQPDRDLDTMTANDGTTSQSILDAMKALRGLARIVSADAPEIVSLTQQIDALAKTDPTQADRMRATLLQLTGNTDDALERIRQLDAQDPNAELDILVDACKCADAQRLYTQHGHPQGGAFSLRLKYGYGCGAFRQMASFAREARDMKLKGHESMAFDQIFNIDSLLDRLQIDDKDTAGVLEVAGQVLLEHRLMFLGDRPSIDLFDVPDVLHAIHLTYHLPTTPEQAVAISVKFVERLVEQNIHVPHGLHVSFSGQESCQSTAKP